MRTLLEEVAVANVMDICISFSNEEYDECANGHERQESLSTGQGPPYKDGM